MFRAYGNRVLVDCSESVPGRSRGGIELPENVTVEPIATGVVLSVGQGVMTAHGWDAPQLRIGDRVQFERRAVRFTAGKQFIGALWAGDVIAVERDADLTRLNGKHPQLTEAN